MKLSNLLSQVGNILRTKPIHLIAWGGVAWSISTELLNCRAFGATTRADHFVGTLLGLAAIVRISAGVSLYVNRVLNKKGEDGRTDDTKTWER